MKLLKYPFKNSRLKVKPLLEEGRDWGKKNFRNKCLVCGKVYGRWEEMREHINRSHKRGR